MQKLEGSSVFASEEIYNCSGLCYFLLRKSGIREPFYNKADIVCYLVILIDVYLEIYGYIRRESYAGFPFFSMSKMWYEIFPNGLISGVEDGLESRTSTLFFEFLFENIAFLNSTRLLRLLRPCIIYGGGFISPIVERLLSLRPYPGGMTSSVTNKTRSANFVALGIGSLLLLLRDVFYTRTITPEDIATIARYNADIERKKYWKFLPQYQLFESNMFSKKRIFSFLSLIHGLSLSYKSETMVHMGVRSPLEVLWDYTDFGSLSFKAYIGLITLVNDLIIFYEPRISFSAYIADFLSWWKYPILGGYCRIWGLFGFGGGRISPLLNNAKFTFPAFFTFYFSDWLIEYLEKKLSGATVQTKKTNLETWSSWLSTKIYGFFKPRYLVKAISFAITSGIGFFALTNTMNDVNPRRHGKYGAVLRRVPPDVTLLNKMGF